MGTDSTRIEHALTLASQAAWQVKGTTSPNPPVGAVILDAHGEVAGVGATSPPGGPHAEINALAQAGDRARGGVAVVTLEPCNHQGRTGPCSDALYRAGITELYYANPDPNPLASGGAGWLSTKGICVTKIEGETPELSAWLGSVALGRPFVTAKIAQTIDGFSAAPDGTSQWITGAATRRFVHEDRQHRDAIMVGTGTVFADNPQLTARSSDSSLLPNQPRRVVIGSRDISATRIHELGCYQYASPRQALTELWTMGVRDVLVEGGPHLISSMLQAKLIDALQIHTGPLLLGNGRLSGGGIALSETLSGAHRLELEWIRRFDDDVVVQYRWTSLGK